MNKYQEAYTEILKIVKPRIDYMKAEDGEEMVQNFNTLSKLVDRATPKKPNNEYDTEFECPTCGYIHEEYDVTTKQFCDQCAQAIDWGNDDET